MAANDYGINSFGYSRFQTLTTTTMPTISVQPSITYLPVPPAPKTALEWLADEVEETCRLARAA
jgi:hypothetical protein